MPNICYLHLGSNVGQREINLKKALQLIADTIGSIPSESNVYETSAWGFIDQDSFLNQAIEVSTELNPQDLLAQIEVIEKELDKDKKFFWGPRRIDIDIIFYSDQLVETDKLTIPHPRMDKRNFVLAPLNEIAADFRHPILDKTVSELMALCTDSGSYQIHEDGA